MEDFRLKNVRSQRLGESQSGYDEICGSNVLKWNNHLLMEMIHAINDDIILVIISAIWLPDTVTDTDKLTQEPIWNCWRPYQRSMNISTQFFPTHVNHSFIGLAVG